jgi:hypothetical protein
MLTNHTFWRTSAVACAMTALSACAPSRPDGGPHTIPVSRSTTAHSELRLRAPRAAKPASESAVRARSAFWDAFYAQRYEAIPGLLRQLGAAVLENPRDAETVLLLGHTHLWKVAERARVEARDPTIVDHLVLAEHYFEEAYRLNPEDHRVIGWLGSVRVSLGAVRQDSVLAAEGEQLLVEGVRRYPQFNFFTMAFTHAGAPPDSPRFRDALEGLWRNVDVCSGVRAGDAARTYELALQADRSCANSQKVPHNFEGFILNLGDMLLRAGRADDAVRAYERARLSPDYASWPYRELLEERIRGATDVVARAREGQRTPMMAGSTLTCAGCHARR